MKYASALTYHTIGCFLKKQLQEGRLLDAFSSHKDALVLEFKTSQKRLFQLVIQFMDGHIYFLNPSQQLQPGKKAITQFKPLHNLTVSDIQVFENERLILIHLEHNKRLLIKGFGRLGNVLLQEETEPYPTSAFRLSLKSDLELNLQELLANVTPVACSDIHNVPIFFDNSNMFYEPGDGRQFMGEGAAGLFAFASQFVKTSRRAQSRQHWVNHWTRQISMHNARIAKLQEQLEEIEGRRSFKELGDIVLAHAHQIKKGVSTALLQDFYTNKPIRIKLNPELDAAENAERFYRKAKNEGLEKSHLKQNIDKTSKALQQAETELKAIVSATEEDRIKPITTTHAEKQVEGKPYKTQIIDGFEVWIGKSAADNDAMLKKAGKQDLWLHVRGFSGSHVIIKRKGTSFPDNVIQKAAELAARNSKAKTQKMVPVIYTERRYVSKPRNAAPGEVAVMKEKVIDIYLNF